MVFRPLQRKRFARGSPLYPYTVPVLAAGASAYIEIVREIPDAKKYAPLDYMELTNNDIVELQVQVNGGQHPLYVPPKTVKELVNAPIHNLKITNQDTSLSTTLGKIYVLVQRLGKG